MRGAPMLAAGVLVVTGFVAAPTTADAAFSACPAKRVCLWGNNDFNWLLIKRPGGRGLAELSGSKNNQMDSWGNRTARKASGRDKKAGTVDCQLWRAGERDDNVAPWNSDEVSSTYTDRGC